MWLEVSYCNLLSLKARNRGPLIFMLRDSQSGYSEEGHAVLKISSLFIGLFKMSGMTRDRVKAIF